MQTQEIFVELLLGLLLLEPSRVPVFSSD